MKRSIIFTAFFLLVFFLSCANPQGSEDIETTGSIQVTEVETDIIRLWLPPYLPAGITSNYRVTDGLEVYRDQGFSELKLDVSEDALVSQWIYVLAAPFSTIDDDIRFFDLKNLWIGKPPFDFVIDRLLVDGSTRAVFEKIWGPASNETVSVISSEELLSEAWKNEDSWAIIPFELLEPQWKVIALDGQSPLDKSFRIERYPLVGPLSVVGKPDLVAEFQSKFGRGTPSPVFPATNRQADKLTKVMVTGVTALVGGTAFLMERNGMTYPAIDIGDYLRSADILHINNEVSFSPKCPKDPFTNRMNLVLCSKIEYIQLLEAIGTDVVELTGDHFIDQDSSAMLQTIDMYEQRGWAYYGGGRDYSDGIRPALFEHNGNKIAFLGCNAKSPGYATASKNSPGAVFCDLSVMADQIKEITNQDYLPIFTFQHIEYLSYEIKTTHQEDFRTAADAGAVVVSGSQAHQPHALEFYKGALLHYGLGNLFFDQYDESQEQRQAFIDEHVFYDGKYISTKLVTIQFIDWARTRFMTKEERTELLGKIFRASGW